MQLMRRLHQCRGTQCQGPYSSRRHRWTCPWIETQMQHCIHIHVGYRRNCLRQAIECQSPWLNQVPQYLYRDIHHAFQQMQSLNHLSASLGACKMQCTTFDKSCQMLARDAAFANALPSAIACESTVAVAFSCTFACSHFSSLQCDAGRHEGRRHSSNLRRHCCRSLLLVARKSSSWRATWPEILLLRMIE